MPHRRLVRSTNPAARVDGIAPETWSRTAVRRASSGAVKNTMSERNPVSIEAGREKKAATKTTTKATAKHSAGKSGKTPAPARRAGARGTATKSSAKAKTSTKSASSARRTTHTASPPASESTAPANATPRLPENRHPGLHERSYTAHLDAGPHGPHTKPAGDLRSLAPFPTGRKQP
jgi:hypothetical protein